MRAVPPPHCACASRLLPTQPLGEPPSQVPPRRRQAVARGCGRSRAPSAGARRGRADRRCPGSRAPFLPLGDVLQRRVKAAAPPLPSPPPLPALAAPPSGCALLCGRGKGGRRRGPGEAGNDGQRGRCGEPPPPHITAWGREGAQCSAPRLPVAVFLSPREPRLLRALGAFRSGSSSLSPQLTGGGRSGAAVGAPEVGKAVSCARLGEGGGAGLCRRRRPCQGVSVVSPLPSPQRGESNSDGGEIKIPPAGTLGECYLCCFL